MTTPKRRRNTATGFGNHTPPPPVSPSTTTEVSMSRLRRFIWVPATMIVVSGLAGAAAGCSGSGSASGGGGASGGGSAVVHASASGGGGMALAPGDTLGTLSRDAAEPAFGVSQGAGGTATGGGKLASDPLKALPALRSAVIKTGAVRLRVDHGQFGRTRQAVRHIAG